VEAIEALRAFFSGEEEVAAVYLYGAYAADRSWPDTDIEIAVLFPEQTSEEAIGAYMERLTEAAPLGGHPGILMPFALNTHTLPVVYEILRGGTLLVDNDPAARGAFVHAAEERIAAARPTIIEEAREAIMQARNLGFALVATDGFMLPQPPRYLDPIRIGWRLARILTSAVMLDQTTREPDRTVRDAERVGQMLGLFSNAAGAATGIGKAMLNIFEMARPPRRWEIFLPLADADLMTTELALQLGAAIELRWSLMTGRGLISPERIGTGIRGTLAPIISFSRLAAWYCDVPGGRTDQPVH